MTARAASASGLQKAAILMVMLGEDAASPICRSLAETDLRRLAQEIAGLPELSPAAASSVLEEFHRLARSQSRVAQGGVEFARKLLARSCGEEVARQWLNPSSTAGAAVPAEVLRQADPQQLAKFLALEHPQTVALTLAHLDPKQAAGLLLRLPDAARAEAVKRLAQLRQFSPEVAQKVAAVLQRKLQTLGEQHRRSYAGFQGVADLMNQLDPVSSKSILEMIEGEDPSLALAIRNLMFTFEDLLTVPEIGIRELLGALDKKTLTLALRGASEELKHLVFKSMSSRAVEMLKEDMEVLGPVRAREVQAAQREVIEVARRLEADGKLMLSAEGDDELLV